MGYYRRISRNTSSVYSILNNYKQIIMDRIKELNILIPRLNSELEDMKPYEDGSGLYEMSYKIKEILEYQKERYKLNYPDKDIPLKWAIIQL